MALAGIQASFVTAEGVDKNKYTSLPDIVCFLEIPADKANTELNRMMGKRRKNLKTPV
jgi:hypothetical protein